MRPLRFFVVSFLFFSGHTFAQPAPEVEVESQDSITDQLLKPKASCFGEPIESLNLPQFNKEVPSQEGGTCYSYAAVGTTEAALFRANEGKPKTLPQLLPAVAVCSTRSNSIRKTIDKSISNGTGMIQDESGITSTTAVDGGLVAPALDAFLGMGRVPSQDSPETRAHVRRINNEYLNKSDDYSSQITELTLKHNGELRKIKREITPLQETVDFKAKQLAELVSQADSDQAAKDKVNSEIEELWKNLDVLYARQSSAEKKYEIEKQKIAMKSCEAGRCYVSDMKKLGQDSKTDFADLSGLASQLIRAAPIREGKCDPFENRKIVEGIMQALCIGTPVSGGIQLGAALTGDGQGGWAASNPGLHAMVIDGVTMHEGKPHFTFRNSWGSGQDQEIILPFSEACKINEVVGVFNRDTIKGEEMSEQLAYVAAVGATVPEGEDGLAAKKLMTDRVAKGWIHVKRPDSSTTTTESGEVIHD